jgi:MSHA biogenesis protein MshM
LGLLSAVEFRARACSGQGRSSEGVLCRLKNLCLGALLEAVRDRTKVVDLKQVNRVLLQPHWRKEADLPQ